MLAFIIIFAILTLIAVVIALSLRFYTTNNDYDDNGRQTRTKVRDKAPNGYAWWTAIGLTVVTGIFFFFGSFYTQDVGMAVVEKDITGNVVGQSNTSGWHWKAPWVNTVDFSIRNQPVTFLNPEKGSTESASYSADGPQITVQDKDGVSSNIDINVRYSIKATAVTSIYTEYKDEDTFKSAFIFQDIRSVVRSVPNNFSTIDLLTDRAAVETAIQKALEARWESAGVTVDSISLQEIRPPEAVVKSYADAQQAQIVVTQEKSNLEAAKVKAQQKVVQAQAESDANSLLNSSLTGPILQQRYLDTLKELAAKGNLVVVPEGFNGLVNVGK